MSNTIKWLMIISQAVTNLIFGFTTPVVHVYFMSLVSLCDGYSFKKLERSADK